MKKIVLFQLIFSLIAITQFSQITYKYVGRGEFYYKGKVLQNGDTFTTEEFLYDSKFEVVDSESVFPEIVIDFTEVSITTYPEYTEIPSGDIDGTNQTFTLQNIPVVQDSFELTLTEYTQVSNETPSDTIDGQNQTFTLQETPVKPGTLEIVIDSDSTNTITDNSNGRLEVNDGFQGTVNYETGVFVLNVTQPSTSIIQSYSYSSDTTITDDATGDLSDGGSIDFTTGIFVLNSQPQTGSELSQDLQLNSKQSEQEFEMDKLQNVKIEIDIDQSNVQDLTLYFNNTNTEGLPLNQDFEAVLSSKYFYKVIIQNTNQDAKYTVKLSDNDLISD